MYCSNGSSALRLANEIPLSILLHRIQSTEIITIIIRIPFGYSE